ncbi:MAG: hypothetical protein VKQ33_05105 [Candidatus Sericytochromatia bacterium]|nr:hypothetical protein [Candidatus Sericytochromatia bacterium]
MPAPLPTTCRRPAYLGTLLLATVAVRGLVGLVRPELDWGSSLTIGLFTVVCLVPTAFRLCHGEELLDAPHKQRRHLVAMVLAGALFLHAIV